jgi:predicted nucleic-acid-binding Zn-ribbon protein
MPIDINNSKEARIWLAVLLPRFMPRSTNAQKIAKANPAKYNIVNISNDEFISITCEHCNLILIDAHVSELLLLLTFTVLNNLSQNIKLRCKSKVEFERFHSANKRGTLKRL